MPENGRMPTILVVTGHYLPGYKAGGPIRSISNLVTWLGDEFDFRIITADRDLDGTVPYPEISHGVWQRCGKAHVRYLAPGEQRPAAMRRILNSTRYDILYLNSFFGAFTRICLGLRWAHLISDRPTIIAPRGEFSPGALALKSTKKRAYLALTRMVKLYDGITWQASSIHEQNDIVNSIGAGNSSSARVVLAPPLARKVALGNRRSMHTSVVADLSQPSQRDESEPNLITHEVKSAGHANMVFLSRISPKKNLIYALKLLSQVKGNVDFGIYGPLEDMHYWKQCERLIDTMPGNVNVRYGGEVAADDVGDVLSSYNLFFFPTLGENFGHVIVEALGAGCPVLLSDQTPWRELARDRVGWDIPLDKPERFRTVLEEVIEMDHATWSEWSQAARAYAHRVRSDPAAIEANRQLFLESLV